MMNKTLVWLHSLLLPKIKVKGELNIPKKEPFILISNHPKSTDGPLIFTLFYLKYNKKVRFLASEKYYKNPVYKLYLNQAKAIIVPKNNRKTSIKYSIKALKKGESIGIFPEGKVNNQKNTKVKTGFVRISEITGCKILPVKMKKNTIKIGKPYKVKINKKTDSLGKVSEKYFKKLMQL